jgi:hypothetical protein
VSGSKKDGLLQKLAALVSTPLKPAAKPVTQ